MDLKAVATAIGGEGAGCVSVVQPYIDIKTQHRQLNASNTPGIGKVSSPALSHLCLCRSQSAQAQSLPYVVDNRASEPGSNKVHAQAACAGS